MKWLLTAPAVCVGPRSTPAAPGGLGMGTGSSAASPLWIKPVSRLALPWGPQRGALSLFFQGTINASTFPRHHYLVLSALPSLWYPSQVGSPFSPPKLSTYDSCQSSCIFIECFLCARVLKKAPYLLALWLGWILEPSFFLCFLICAGRGWTAGLATHRAWEGPVRGCTWGVQLSAHVWILDAQQGLTMVAMPLPSPFHLALRHNHYPHCVEEAAEAQGSWSHVANSRRAHQAQRVNSCEVSAGAAVSI